MSLWSEQLLFKTTGTRYFFVQPPGDTNYRRFQRRAHDAVEIPNVFHLALFVRGVQIVKTIFAAKETQTLFPKNIYGNHTNFFEMKGVLSLSWGDTNFSKNQLPCKHMTHMSVIVKTASDASPPLSPSSFRPEGNRDEHWDCRGILLP